MLTLKKSAALIMEEHHLTSSEAITGSPVPDCD